MNDTAETRVSASELLDTCQGLLRKDARMQLAYAWFPENGAKPEVLYLIDEGPEQSFALLRCEASDFQLPSLAAVSPLLGWYEREMKDLCGISFSGHPEPYPLVLQEGVSVSIPPLNPAYPSGEEVMFTPIPWHALEVESKDIQRLPFGPVRADVLESAQIVFYYVGEAILHCHPQLFFKHRGMEKRFESLYPDLAVLLAERVSGVDTVAHSLAFCQAVEGACHCTPPARALYLRVLLAELERFYNHIHYLGYLCHTTTLKVGEAEGKLLEERAKWINSSLTGSRFLRSLLTPGGLRRDLDLRQLRSQLTALMPELQEYMSLLENTNSHLDRLMTTGVLATQVAFDQGASGPIKRASGIDRDLRRDHSYAAYSELAVRVPVRSEGDAHARAQVRMEEISASWELIEQILDRIPEGPVRSEIKIPPGAEGLGWAEGSRGSIYYAVHFALNGSLRRVKIKSPSFSNWRVFPFTVHDTNMMDYAINEASFGLTIAGCDR